MAVIMHASLCARRSIHLDTQHRIIAKCANQMGAIIVSSPVIPAIIFVFQ
jgi:hypothetical protein